MSGLAGSQSRMRKFVYYCVAWVVAFLLAIALPSKAGEPETAQKRSAPMTEALQQALPLSHDDIIEYRQRKDMTQRAMRERPVPTVQSRTFIISADPSAPAPIIEMMIGYEVALVFVDATGAPWPIISPSIGASNWFSVEPIEHADDNVLIVSSRVEYANSNLTVVLKGYPIPVTLQLRSYGASPDKTAVLKTTISPAVLQIPARGPRAAQPMIGELGLTATGSTGAPVESAISKTLISFLDNVPPEGAQTMALQPSPPETKVWSYDNKLYLRTNRAAVWPAWTAVVRGAANLVVYEMPLVPSVMIAGPDGSTAKLSVQR